jgi:hypothetical protein
VTQASERRLSSADTQSSRFGGRHSPDTPKDKLRHKLATLERIRALDHWLARRSEINKRISSQFVSTTYITRASCAPRYSQVKPTYLIMPAIRRPAKHVPRRHLVLPMSRQDNRCIRSCRHRRMSREWERSTARRYADAHGSELAMQSRPKAIRSPRFWQRTSTVSSRS